MTALLNFIIPNELQYACMRLVVYTSVQLLVYGLIAVAISAYTFHLYWYTYYANRFDTVPFGWKWIAYWKWCPAERAVEIRSEASRQALIRGRRIFSALLQGQSFLIVAWAIVGPVLIENETCLAWTRF